MLLLMVVGLVTSRVVVRALGQEEFGIYGAVAGRKPVHGTDRFHVGGHKPLHHL